MTDACRNCGTPLAGRWCHACGQDSSTVLRPWRELLAEWGDAVLGWETRTGRSLRALLLEPGRLTVEYAIGHRAAWLHPLRLYLGVSVVTLAVFGATTDRIVEHIAAQGGPTGVLSQMGQLMLLVSTAMFLLLPAHAVTYALAFRRARRFYVEHLVLVLHATSFLFIAHASASLLQYFGALLDAPYWLIIAMRMAAHLASIVYGWRAVRRVYGLGVWQTLWRLALAVGLFMPMFGGAVWLIFSMRT
jgi:hypothetical protein